MDTIVAISTAIGIGGIGIIRISGNESFTIVNKIFKSKNLNKNQNIIYGTIINPENNKIVDEVLVSFFKGPKSYTKEDVCEINSHGGIVVMNEILELCLKNGARLAEPGEFTKRAFLNGRIDLAQAEAVIDMINAKTKKEKESAINQLEGYLSKKVNLIKQDIIDILVNIEASIDYPEYDIEELTRKQIEKKLNEVEGKINKLLESFEKGKIIKNGIKVSIIGKPNVGKSSLLNCLLKEERAIVTDIEGTTRDIIEETIVLRGIPLTIIDTAGIRNTNNKVEKIGIEKTKKIVEKSDLIIAMFDSSKELTSEDEEILDMIKNKKTIILLNKADLKENKLEENDDIIKTNKKIIKFSTVEEIGIEELYNEIENLFNINEISLDNQAIVTNARHKNLIERALEELHIVKKSIKEDIPIDMISINIKNILENLGEITGDNISEDIIKAIFSKFCLGK